MAEAVVILFQRSSSCKWPVAPYDVVFIDPPFKLQLVETICAALAQKQLLREDALVYVETGATEPPPSVPPTWSLYREKVSGGVAYRLFRVGQAENPR